MFGGSSDIGTDDQRPSDECLIAISGPAVSILVTGLALAARWGVPNPSQPLAIFLESLILLNLWLGIFNLLPTLPLDGGRLIRGLLWQRSGDYQWATRIAALIGRGLAFTIFGAGLALFIASLDGARSQVPSIAGVDPRSIAIVAMLVGWLLNWGARTAQRQVMLQGRFSGVLVSQLMVSDPPRVHPWTPLTEVVEQEFLQRGERGVAVVREDDALVGLVAYRDARKIPTSDWPNRAAGEVMTPVAELITVTPEDNAEVAIRHMAQRHFNQIPVVAEGRLVGMISRGDVLRFVEATGGRRPL
jgi:CBS domain-containing protein